MTVHKAKGLEFPVVILADLTCRISRGDASRHVDPGRRLCAMKIGGWAPHDLHDHEGIEVVRDQAEGVRLAYVAATRARDLLVVPALGDGPWEGGWFSPLNRALYPSPADRRQAARAPRSPAFTSKDSVLARPDDEIASAATVSPGQHILRAEGPGQPAYPVVWWDPHALDLGARPSFGVRRDDLIVKDVARDVVADGRSRYDRWRLACTDARTAGNVPSLQVATAGRWASDSAADAGAVLAHVPTTVVDAWEQRPGGRGAGPAFGLLVHALLAQVPFDAPDDWLAQAAAVEARVLGLGEPDALAAVSRVERVLRLDLLERARQAMARDACRRETAVTCVMPDGTLVEGVVDLAFEEDGRWVVVDYKTDAELAADGEERYRRQIGVYATAIARATGRPASGVIVRV
jgi:ATP-dependent exoDNAse (exonuclease V) beta subunit